MTNCYIGPGFTSKKFGVVDIFRAREALCMMMQHGSTRELETWYVTWNKRSVLFALRIRIISPALFCGFGREPRTRRRFSRSSE